MAWYSEANKYTTQMLIDLVMLHWKFCLHFLSVSHWFYVGKYHRFIRGLSIQKLTSVVAMYQVFHSYMYSVVLGPLWIFCFLLLFVTFHSFIGERWSFSVWTFETVSTIRLISIFAFLRAWKLRLTFSWRSKFDINQTMENSSGQKFIKYLLHA